ncbi:unnamed protein product [Amoebophrya sp. A120]|nr:unnamed protein product [Amoebophrya sp. A120]|eukprot:GSA120T00007763001.1
MSVIVDIMRPLVSIFVPGPRPSRNTKRLRNKKGTTPGGKKNYADVFVAYTFSLRRFSHVDGASNNLLALFLATVALYFLFIFNISVCSITSGWNNYDPKNSTPREPKAVALVQLTTDTKDTSRIEDTTAAPTSAGAGGGFLFAYAYKTHGGHEGRVATGGRPSPDEYENGLRSFAEPDPDRGLRLPDDLADDRHGDEQSATELDVEDEAQETTEENYPIKTTLRREQMMMTRGAAGPPAAAADRRHSAKTSRRSRKHGNGEEDDLKIMLEETLQKQKHQQHSTIESDGRTTEQMTGEDTSTIGDSSTPSGSRSRRSGATTGTTGGAAAATTNSKSAQLQMTVQKSSKPRSLVRAETSPSDVAAVDDEHAAEEEQDRDNSAMDHEHDHETLSSDSLLEHDHVQKELVHGRSDNCSTTNLDWEIWPNNGAKIVVKAGQLNYENRARNCAGMKAPDCAYYACNWQTSDSGKKLHTNTAGNKPSVSGGFSSPIFRFRYPTYKLPAGAMGVRKMKLSMEFYKIKNSGSGSGAALFLSRYANGCDADPKGQETTYIFNLDGPYFELRKWKNLHQPGPAGDTVASTAYEHGTQTLCKSPCAEDDPNDVGKNFAKEAKANSILKKSALAGPSEWNEVTLELDNTSGKIKLGANGRSWFLKDKTKGWIKLYQNSATNQICTVGFRPHRNRIRIATSTTTTTTSTAAQAQGGTAAKSDGSSSPTQQEMKAVRGFDLKLTVDDSTDVQVLARDLLDPVKEAVVAFLVEKSPDLGLTPADIDDDDVLIDSKSALYSSTLLQGMTGEEEMTGEDVDSSRNKELSSLQHDSGSREQSNAATVGAASFAGARPAVASSMKEADTKSEVKMRKTRSTSRSSLETRTRATSSKTVELQASVGVWGDVEALQKLNDAWPAGSNLLGSDDVAILQGLLSQKIDETSALDDVVTAIEEIGPHAAAEASETRQVLGATPGKNDQTTTTTTTAAPTEEEKENSAAMLAGTVAVVGLLLAGGIAAAVTYTDSAKQHGAEEDNVDEEVAEGEADGNDAEQNVPMDAAPEAGGNAPLGSAFGGGGGGEM